MLYNFRVGNEFSFNFETKNSKHMEVFKNCYYIFHSWSHDNEKALGTLIVGVYYLDLSKFTI